MSRLIFADLQMFDWLESKGDASDKNGVLYKVYLAVTQNVGAIYHFLLVVGYALLVIWLLIKCINVLFDHAGRRSSEGFKGFLLRWMIVVVAFSSVLVIAGLALKLGGKL